MNVQLLNRTTRSVTLSEAGLRLRDELRELLPRMESALHPSCDHSVLRLGFTWLFPDGWTRRAIARFEEESGTCVVLVRRDDRFAGVDVGHAHVSLLRRQPTASGLRAVRLAEEARVAAVADTSPLARRKSLYWTELADHSLVVNTVSGATFAEDWPEEHRPDRVVTCGNFDEWLELVAADRGVGVAPDLVLRRHLHPSVCFVPLVGAPPGGLWFTAPASGGHPLAERFMQILKEARAEEPYLSVA